MAIEAKKYLTPLIYKGEPVTFPTFGTQVFLNDGKPLETDGKIRALSSSNSELDDTLESIPIDADTLGGISATEYALKFENWSDEEKTALVEYVLSALTNARGVGF